MSRDAPSAARLGPKPTQLSIINVRNRLPGLISETRSCCRSLASRSRMSGLFGGLPGAGATMGAVVNIQSGARTPLAGMIRAGLLLVVVPGAARLTEQIPLAVLAGIALYVGFNILDWGLLKRPHRLSWRTAAIMHGVMLLTVFVDLIVAVGVGSFNYLDVIGIVLTREREGPGGAHSAAGGSPLEV